MTPSLRLPTVCPITIGRDAHLVALDVALDALAAGRGQMLALTGEAGIGKSRLVADLRARAVERGMGVLEGRCFEPDRALPYAPLLDLLREVVAGQSPAEAAPLLGPGAQTLLALLPEFAPLPPAIGPPRPIPSKRSSR